MDENNGADVLAGGQNEQQICEGQCELNEELSENVHDILQEQNEQQSGDQLYETNRTICRWA